MCDSIRSGWLTSGPKVRAFEQAFANYVGANFPVAVNSCAAAMHLALEAHGIGPKDAVVTSDYTFTASAEVIRYLGATPVFVDINPVMLTLSPAALARALAENPRIRAVIPVHTAGHPCDMAGLREAIAGRDVVLIEDAAHSLPSELSGQRIGAASDGCCFSFYVTKTLCTEEGSMLTTDSVEIAARARTMRLHGIDADVFAWEDSERPLRYYEVVAPDFKYNMTDLAAAIGLHQLRRQDEFCELRSRTAARYDSLLANCPVTPPHGKHWLQARVAPVHLAAPAGAPNLRSR